MRAGASPARRRELYYGVCVPARLALACLVLVIALALEPGGRLTAGDRRAASAGALVALLGSLLAAAANLFFAARPGCRWWSPAANAACALGAAAAAAAVLGGRLAPASGALVVATMLYLSVVVGTGIAAVEKPFGPPG